MASHEQIEIVSPTGQVRFFALDPAVGVVNIGRHPDNDIVLDGQDVHAFHALIDCRRRPFQYILLEEDGGLGAEQAFTAWDRLRIGGHELLLVHSDQAGPQTAPGSLSPGHGETHPRPVTPLPADAGNGDVHWRVQPGQTVRQSLTIQNSGDSPATFILSADGVPADWLWLSQQGITLQPGGQAAVQLAVTPPIGPQTQPGVYPLTWRMESPDYPGWAQSEALYLQVEAAAIVHLSRPEPAHVVSRAWRRAGRAHVTVANWGNQPAAVYVTGHDRRDNCTVQIDPVLAHPEPEEGVAWERPQANGRASPTDLMLLLPAGAVAHLQVTITPRSGQHFGMGAIHHRFTLSAQSPDGSFASQTSSGTFESRPAIRMGFLMLLVFVLILAGIYLLRGALSTRFGRAGQTPIVNAAQADMPHLAWLAPTADSIPRPLLATGGARPDQTGAMTYAEMFQKVAALYGMDWRQLVAHAQRESRLNPNAQGASGEVGLMQILPATWDEWAPLVQVDDPWDPYSNILVGAAYYSYIHSYFSDLGYTDPQWSLAAYNWGPDRVLTLLDKGGDWFSLPLTQRMYVADVLLGVENAPTLVQEAEIRYPR